MKYSVELVICKGGEPIERNILAEAESPRTARAILDILKMGCKAAWAVRMAAQKGDPACPDTCPATDPPTPE